MYTKIALVGNPNTGKSSLFNILTGLNQHVGNFPGLTVDKKTGRVDIEGKQIELIDLPGTYSIYPRSSDEKMVYDILSDPSHSDFPEALIVVVDSSNLQRNLLFFSQVYELGLPTLLLLNMQDIAHKKGIEIDISKLQGIFPDILIVETNVRVRMGISRLKTHLANPFPQRNQIENGIISVTDHEKQVKDTENRFHSINTWLSTCVSINMDEKKNYKPNLLDKFFIHPIFGYSFFLLVLLTIFQLIFSFAAYPMGLIDALFGQMGNWLTTVLPPGFFTDLISKGIIPGIGGVIIFLPQLILLFFTLGILEETGYMSRVIFIMDKLMRPFGLNGRSVVPLLSSAACAIPGIMATRTISNWKERLITIMVAPLISCSARIPVFTLLIGLVIPNKTFLGFINLQGLVFFGLYVLGLISALCIAILLKFILKTNEPSLLMLELPTFKWPRWGNIFINVLEKGKLFLWDAGKVIVSISILLWALGTFGPKDRIEKAVNSIEKPVGKTTAEKLQYQEKVSAIRFENSYMGILGKSIEPIIAPLGYDWKIGVCLLTSFAAREVFVGSMATIYSIGDHDKGDMSPLLKKLKDAKRTDGSHVFSLATGLSLMVFYVFAMQCMATLAVVKKETKSWKWPLIQLAYMGILAYLASYITFNLFS